jgi:hypothetical protein
MKRKKLLTILWMAILSLNVFGQYCITGLGGNCTSRPIADVSMANMANNANGCVSAAGTNFADFTANPSFQINVTAGQSYFLRVKIDGATTARIGAWIDWSQDSIWSTSAEFYNITLAGATLEDSISITVPTTAINGNYRLRVRSRPGTGANFTTGQSCTNVANGEIEDYTITVSGGTAPSPYCASAPSNNADDDIGIFSLGSFTNTSVPNTLTLPLNNPASTATYTDFTNLAPITLLSPLPTPISITQVNEDIHFPCFAKVWIDLNQDSIFQNPGELVFSSIQSQDPSITPGGNILSGSIILPPLNPGTVEPGITRLRVVLSEEDPNTTMSPCSSVDYFYGETEDYLVDIQQASGCTGTPTAGTTALSADSVCLGAYVNISLIGSSAASGISYQWQSSNTLAGPYTNISGATSPNYTDTVDANNIFFICEVTCINSGLSATSTAAGYYLNPISQCFCTSFAQNSNDDDIGNFTIGSFSNGTCVTPALNNPCSDSVYTDYSNLGPISILSPLSYPVSITQINSASFFGCYAKVWIDFNKDGQFQDSTELVYTSTQSQDPSITPSGNILNGNINIPALNPGVIDTGIMKMRVVLSEDDPASLINACGSYDYGETEDYLVNLQQAVGCSGTPVAGNTVASDTTLCLGAVANFSINGSTQASGITYQWQENGLNIIGATGPILSDTVTGPSVYTCIVTCNNTSSSATTTAVTLVVNPFSICYCAVAADFSFGTDIGNVTVGSFTNGNASPVIGNSTANNVYTSYTNLTPIPMFSGIPNNIQFTGITNTTFISGTTIDGKVWIDYNQDGTFDPITELAVSGTGNYTSVTGSVISGAPVIPSTALAGVTGMRIMLFEDPFSNPCSAPSFSAGEVEDYLVDIQLASACAGAPNGGNATTSDSLICSNSTINLNANSATIGLGITYQWQASSTLSGPYTNITNATNLLYPTDSVSTPTYFQCEVTCTNSGQSSISAPIFVGVNPADSCYCFTGLGGFCNSASIDGFTIFQTSLGVNTTTNLDNQGNGCSTGVGNQAYTAYGFGIGTDATLAKTDSFTVQIITDGGTASQAKVFTDWNRDGVWNNTNELLTVCSPCSNDTVTATYLIDPSANIGDTIRIRVRTRQATIVDACELLGSGETEDYFIVISNTTVLTVNNVAAKAISNIKLYPNPTTGILNYELPTSVKKASISVSDLLGRTLISKSGNNTNAIDLSVLKNGTYNVTMNLDGKLIQSKVILNK